MTEQEVRAIFTVAGIVVKHTYECANGYSRERKDPWWLVQTEIGLILIGWRKRVINIDWSGAEIGGQPLVADVTSDEVTKDETSVHAWSKAKAVEYLTALRREATDIQHRGWTRAAEAEISATQAVKV